MYEIWFLINCKPGNIGISETKPRYNRDICRFIVMSVNNIIWPSRHICNLVGYFVWDWLEGLFNRVDGIGQWSNSSLESLSKPIGAAYQQYKDAPIALTQPCNISAKVELTCQ